MLRHGVGTAYFFSFDGALSFEGSDTGEKLYIIVSRLFQIIDTDGNICHFFLKTKKVL